MLVMDRKYGESFFVGETLIRIKQRKGKGVRLVIDAPPDVRVVRGEENGQPAQAQERGEPHGPAVRAAES